MAQYIDTLSWFNVVFHIVIMTVGLCCYLEFFPDTSKVIPVLQIQIQTKNYTAKYNANTKTESCLNPNSCRCY